MYIISLSLLFGSYYQLQMDSASLQLYDCMRHGGKKHGAHDWATSPQE